ncbi:MAG: hypothetical protein DRN03_04690 [Thermoplasmata archaeon]|nr:MAG: hypothetical protein DRN03_04690 [Thermoplasmata archaeon]
MGFSTTAAVAIICTSLLFSINLALTSMLPSISDLNDSYRLFEKKFIERKETDIDITNVTSTNGTPFNLSIEVKNTGSVTLETEDFTIIINGEMHNYSCSEPYLFPGRIVNFTVTGLTERGETRIKVVTGNGIEKYEVWSV